MCELNVGQVATECQIVRETRMGYIEGEKMLTQEKNPQFEGKKIW